MSPALPTPRASAVTVTVVTAGLLAVVAVQVDNVTVPILLGAVGSLCLAGGLWLGTGAAAPARGAVGASLLVVPAGAAIAAAPAVTMASVGRAIFPVPDASLVSISALVIAGHVGVVLGATVAAVGLWLSAHEVPASGSVQTFGRIAALTGIAPLVLAAGLTVTALLTTDQTLSDGPALPGGLPAPGRLVFGPPPQAQALDLWSFLLLLAGGLIAVRRVLRTAPPRELLEGGTASVVGPVAAPTNRDQTADSRVETALQAGLALTAGLALVAVVAELLFTPDELAGLVGPAVYDALRVVTTADGVRAVLLGIAVLGLGVSGLASAASKLANTQRQTLVQSLVALAVGSGLAVGATVAADPVYTAIVDWTATRLPAPVKPEWRMLTENAAELYGAPALVLWLLTGGIAVVLAVVAALRWVRSVGALTTGETGAALAGIGLFAAAVSAGTVDAPAWLVFAGVFGGLFVWDTGRFGSELATELGRNADLRTLEVVHAGAALVVGAAGVGTAAVLAGLLGTRAAASPPTLALLGITLGLICLVAALR